MTPSVTIERARLADVPTIHQLINYFADRGDMLHRSLGELYENVRDFFVARDGGEVVGCGSLHIVWQDLAELKSLAVAESHQGQGLGTRLVEACLAEARELGLANVFCLTYQVDFFARRGFERLDVMELPRKVWGECIRCPKFPHCDEVAMIYRLTEHAPALSRPLAAILATRH